jgi:hypothetical protein
MHNVEIFSEYDINILRYVIKNIKKAIKLGTDK